MDSENFGNKEWNPLGDYVRPGSRILLKPNWVNHVNKIGGLDCTVTHPSVIRCIIDYCVVAKAKIIEIGDAPIQDCNFDFLMETHGYRRLFDYVRNKGVDILVSDFRITVSKYFLSKRIILQNKNKNRCEVVEFDLVGNSNFGNIEQNQRYRSINYPDDKLNNRHNKNHHKYLINKSIFTADLIINLPKPKSHRFAGITAAQKNFIGICSEKDYLPHYRIGAPENSGDESNKLSILGKIFSLLDRQRCKNIEKRNIFMQFFYGFMQYCIMKYKNIFASGQYFFNGRWHGNDTIWRTILDVNSLLLYGHADGNLDFNSPPRNILTIGDMIISGEKEGPLKPSPKPLGIILVSNNSALFDYIFCKIAQFDYTLIPTVKNSIGNKFLFRDSLDKISMCSNQEDLSNILLNNISFPMDWRFKPNSAWEEIINN
ncbi:conserved hypothetical protein [Treponema primitia ZAS-2]|uniref:DUF362 domain-containing protein n=1 Tax=Treponema primitia (strain ATCC BAA-887 / DSM 12427 / ZAS-2) TaxID=545694 RepID=F5YN32_TREPZ|nr:conserved hypothetical protein [Treponema primitia ZAS-2]